MSNCSKPVGNWPAAPAAFVIRPRGELVDHCQHVSMGCCTNLADFCHRTNIADCFRRDARLHFFTAEGRRYDLAASRWLPAPLHLAPGFLQLGYLTLRERLSIARTLWRLRHHRTNEKPPSPGREPGDLPIQPDSLPTETIGVWLRAQGQSEQAIKLFWEPVLISALGESLDRASLTYARKVFVDGFMVSRDGYQIEVPRVPLGELYGERLGAWLAARGVVVHLESAVTRIIGNAERVEQLLVGEQARPFDAMVVAVPWTRAGDLVADSQLHDVLPELDRARELESSPITGVHLWFDREITPLPHAVLVGTTSQWVFNHGASVEPGTSNAPRHYYQVVISASRNLAGQDREKLIQEIVTELGRVWPSARHARLLHWRLVTEQAAVFSVNPRADLIRPPQRTAIANLALAGDWTATGWPATMEGAVRSGYLAAEVILAHFGRPERIVVPDLERGTLARLLCGN